MVVVQFIVEKDGSIADAEIIRSIGGGCDEEVLKVVYMMPNWVPGKQRGKAVRVQFNLPVKFKLDNDSPGLNISNKTYIGMDEPPAFQGCDHLNGEERKTCSYKMAKNYIARNVSFFKKSNRR